jgi:hypothetical protein
MHISVRTLHQLLTFPQEQKHTFPHSVLFNGGLTILWHKSHVSLILNGKVSLCDHHVLLRTGNGDSFSFPCNMITWIIICRLMQTTQIISNVSAIRIECRLVAIILAATYFGWVVSNEASQALRPFSDLFCVPIWVLIPMIHPSVFSDCTSHLAVTQEYGEKCSWILLTLPFNHSAEDFLTCRKFFRHGASGFTFHPKENALRIFIAIKIIQRFGSF